MKFLSVIMHIALCLGTVSCESNFEEPSVNYKVLSNALLYFDEDVVIEELNILTIDLEPKNGDHTKNFDILIDRIGNQNSEMTAEMGCYACIETAPPQSEILVDIDSAGTQVSRIIDILTPDDGALKCVGMHN